MDFYNVGLLHIFAVMCITITFICIYITPFKTGEHLPPISMQERVDAARSHLQMAIDWKGETLGVLETRRHYTNYFKGIPNFKEYRMKMVTSDNSVDVFEAFDENWKGSDHELEPEKHWGLYKADRTPKLVMQG